MMRNIEIISSILGSIGIILGFIKFVLNPYLIRKEEFKTIRNIVYDSYNRWKELKFYNRGENKIPKESFLIINKYRSKFTNEIKEIKAYLLRNAICYGASGNWGFWLDMNKDNEYILMPLFLALDKSLGNRPAWRSAYILEKIFSKNIEKIDLFISKIDIDIENCKSILDSIREKTVEQEILRLSKEGTMEEREKLKDVIVEIKIFLQESNKFAKEQSII